MADSGSADKTKGKLKQAAGDLTDDKDLKNEGRVDKTSGSIKSAVDKAKDALHRDR
jgi:uncharacterized protein YjbJ (UPF0337 family)